MNKLVFDNQWLKVYDNNGYLYSERKGKDSIAFILSDSITGLIGVIKEFKPPINDFLVTAFGGSLDKPDKSPLEICIEEVREEAGYEVTDKHIQYKGKVMVSTQSNQFCHLFQVDVTDLELKERQPENDLEAMAEVVWLPRWRVSELQDWKAITILRKQNEDSIL